MMPNIFNNARGSMFLTVILTVAVLVGGGMIYYYYAKLESLEPTPIPIVVNQAPKIDPETVNWRQYKNSELEITFRYPNEWYLSEDNKYISQFPFDSRRIKQNSIYNDFYVIRTTVQLQSGYTNYEWLDGIYNLKEGETLTNEFRPATSLRLAKFGSGHTASGQRYVLFKNLALDEGLTAAFEKDEFVYLVILRHYDKIGEETFPKILNTIVTGN